MNEAGAEVSASRSGHLIALALLILIILSQLLLTQSWHVFSRNFWLDEVHTDLIASPAPETVEAKQTVSATLQLSV